MIALWYNVIIFKMDIGLKRNKTDDINFLNYAKIHEFIQFMVNSFMFLGFFLCFFLLPFFQFLMIFLLLFT